MSLNTIITIGLLVLGAIAVYVFVTGKKGAEEQKTEFLATIDTVADATVEYINSYIGANLLGMNLSRREYLAQEEHRKEVGRQVRNCASGNEGARETVKALIRQYIEKNVPETELARLYDTAAGTASAENLFETMMFKFDPSGTKGFSIMLDRLGDDYKTSHCITEDDIRNLYRKSSISLTARDRVELITQYIYCRRFGLGCIDTLNYQRGVIEEIQMGLSGPGAEGYRYQERLADMGKDIRLSRDAIHISVSGRIIGLPFLRFSSDAEMKRVLNNLLVGTDAGELTRSEPYKITESVDGRRLTVSRPDASDAWFGLVRKFDTVTIKELNDLLRDTPGWSVVRRVLDKVLWSGGNIAVCGPMNAGKTSVLRGLMLSLPDDQSIRTIENESFELNLRSYMPGRNVTAIRTTKHLKEADAMSILKKSNGQICAVGELTTLDVNKLYLDLCKVARQVLCTGHHNSADDLIADLKNGDLANGFTSEKLAEVDAVGCVNFYIHRVARGGIRVIDRIDEIVPDFDIEGRFKDADDVLAALDNLRLQLGTLKTYKVIPICRYNWDEMRYEVLNDISEPLRAEYKLNREQYGLFVDEDLKAELLEAVEEEGNEEGGKEEESILDELPIPTISDARRPVNPLGQYN